MKTKFAFLALLFLSTINSQLSTCLAQGSLTPPGAPAPTMKTLAQVEPRTPIATAPVTITQPGSYYLTTNLAGSVTIAADNVTLDLMGFTIIPASGSAILQSGPRSRVLVRNGILSAPTANGIDFSTSTALAGTIFEDLRIYDCQNYGIAVGGGCIVRRCQVQDAGMAGIRASGNSEVRDCTVTGSGIGLQASGANARFSGNAVRGNTDNYNFSAGNQLDLVLSEVPETIDWSAQVTLAGSLTVTNGDAITITTNGVTLDLGGFTLKSTAASAAGTAIQLNGGLKNITIANGFIEGGVTNNGSGVYSGSGFGYGIYYSGFAVNVLVSRVSVSGCRYYGIYLRTGDSTVVENCTVRTVGSYGIHASTINTSSVIDCGGSAIYGSHVSDCRGESLGGDGIYAITAQNCYGSSENSHGVSATTAQNCYGYSGSGNGVSATIAQNCSGYSSSGTGVYAARTAIGCYGSSPTGTGLYAQNANTCTGYRSGGTAIQATIANGCYAASGTNNITYKYNMP